MPEQSSAVKQQLEANREASEKSRKEAMEKLSKGKPTPTQDENDRAKLGEHVVEHEDDGSGPDPHAQKNLEAQQHSGGYQTRQSTARRDTSSGGAGPSHSPSRST